MFTLLIFLIILGLLVLSHEFGHFICTRKSGMKVYEFGFGFPPRCCGVQKLTKKEGNKVLKKWRFVWGSKDAEELSQEKNGWLPDTLYSFNYLPLGGFVKIKGEEGDNTDADSFVSQSFTKKSITIVAGVVMNVLLAIVIFSFGFMIGLPQSVDGLDDSVTVKDRQLQIMQVLPNMPAGAANLKAGDAIIKVDSIENPRLKQMQEYVDKNKDKEINLKIKRGKETLEKKITPTVYEDTGKGGLGISITEVGIIKYPWYRAVYEGVILTFLYLKAILFAFYYIIKGLIVGNGVGAAVSGPIGIAVMTGQVAKLGIHYLLNFTAVLSLNLAILNILPIPALDGGRLIFLIIGKAFKKNIAMKHEQMAHTIGFLLLMLMVVVITIKDVDRFTGGFKNIIDKIF